MTSTLARQPTAPATAAASPAPAVDRTGIPPDAQVSVHAADGSAVSADGLSAPTAGGPPGAVRVADGAGQRHSASTGHLVAEVTSDVSTLFRQEIALAKAELREEATKAGKGAGMFAGAGGAGFFALVFVLLAAMFGLGTVMALGWAALIVGAILAIAAGTLALLGRRTMRAVHPTPTQTVETLREDVQWAQNRRH